MKRLLVIPLLFAIAACAPVNEKIKDRSGGCLNGSCVDGPTEKPSACRSSNGNTINEFVGRNFLKTETSSSGVVYDIEYRFTNGNMVTHVLTCTSGDKWTNVKIDSSISYHSTKKLLRFDKPAKASNSYAGGTCATELTSEEFSVSYEGMCLVLTDSKRTKLYLPRVN